MAAWIQKNLSMSLTAFSERDAELALRVVRDSSFLDDVYDQILRRLFTYIASDPAVMSQASQPMSVAQALQHAGDHVVDIAELVVLLHGAGNGE
jgi:phosphate uptake regulator